MKYMIMLYASQRDHDAMAGRLPEDDPDGSAEDLAAMHAFMEKWNQDLVESGEFVDANGLAAPVHTRRFHTRDGVPVVTDGPSPETAEVLGALVRRYGHFDTAEDAVQEALLAAASQWPDGGVPADPRAWLIKVASRRLTDLLRARRAGPVRASHQAAAERTHNVPEQRYLNGKAAALARD